MKRYFIWLSILIVFSIMVVSGCKSQSAGAMPASESNTSTETSPTSIVEFSLQTGVQDGRMVYIGVGGDIDGLVNPDIVIQPDVTVQANLINGDGISHDLSFPDFGAKTPLVASKGKTVTVTFDVEADNAGTYPYFCTQPGHRQAGQEGQLIVSKP